MPTIYQADSKKPKAKKKKPHYLDTLEIIKKEFKQRTKNPLAAFSVFPKKIKFETQEDKEKIILLLRKHLITNISWILLTLIMILTPLVLTVVPLLEWLPVRFQFMSVIIWYLLILAFILESFLSWYFNVYIITDERIIDVDFYSLIYKNISETKIDRIQDVSYSQGGILQAIFNYGDVRIQTAGEVPEFEFQAVPQPARITKILNQLTLQEEREKLEGRVS